MKPFKQTIFAWFIFLSGCTTVVPRELVDARAAYGHAAASRAADLTPAELHKAEIALARAETAFSSEPRSRVARDLSYVAERRAQLAEALAGIELCNRQAAAAGRNALTDTRERLALSDRRTVDADRGAADAGTRAKAVEALASLAAVRSERRGLVITLAGSLLFISDQATLLPGAQARLDQVADALMATRERTVIVEGHTDSHGSEIYNMDLSQRRADAVRSYLVAHGYESARIQARGFGQDRPVGGNDTAQGRANNRRVEIVIEHSKDQ